MQRLAEVLLKAKVITAEDVEGAIARERQAADVEYAATAAERRMRTIRRRQQQIREQNQRLPSKKELAQRAQLRAPGRPVRRQDTEKARAS